MLCQLSKYWIWRIVYCLISKFQIRCATLNRKEHPLSADQTFSSISNCTSIFCVLSKCRFPYPTLKFGNHPSSTLEILIVCPLLTFEILSYISYLSLKDCSLQTIENLSSIAYCNSRGPYFVESSLFESVRSMVGYSLPTAQIYGFYIFLWVWKTI
jgi:hypothetical protein